MKLIREHINEKFDDHSDHIKDMGIGGIQTGVIRAQLKKEYRENFVKTFTDLLLNKTVTGTFNQTIVAMGNEMKSGDGWGKYTIHIDKISEFDEDSMGLTVFDDKKRAAYIIPYDEQKIFVR